MNERKFSHKYLAYRTWATLLRIWSIRTTIEIYLFRQTKKNGPLWTNNPKKYSSGSFLKLSIMNFSATFKIRKRSSTVWILLSNKKISLKHRQSNFKENSIVWLLYYFNNKKKNLSHQRSQKVSSPNLYHWMRATQNWEKKCCKKSWL